jgi:hypothetical protein
MGCPIAGFQDRSIQPLWHASFDDHIKPYAAAFSANHKHGIALDRAKDSTAFCDDCVLLATVFPEVLSISGDNVAITTRTGTLTNQL